jgi:hypothetical protein
VTVHEVVELRVCIVLTIFATFFAGCKKDAVRNTHKVVRQSNPFELNPIPAGEYDALFTCYETISNYRRDSSYGEYFADISFPIDTRQNYHLPKGVWIPPTITVSINGDTLKRGMNERVSVNFPEPLIWHINGDDYFPSVVHTTPSDSSIEFLFPNNGDSISLSQAFVVKFRAPKNIDTIQIHMSYFGKSVLKRDTTGKIQDMGQSYYYLVPNTGNYLAPLYKKFDYYKSFDPKSLFVDISWARGDTVHAGNSVYGFVTQCNCSHWFRLKR